MIKINLLPKESKKVTVYNKILFAGIILFILVLISLSGLYYYFYDQSNILSKRIKILDDEISKIDKPLKQIQNMEAEKKPLLSKLKTFNNLSNNCGEISIILHEISKVLPEDIWITSLKNENMGIYFIGNTYVRESMDILVKNLNKSIFFNNIKLRTIKEIPHGDKIIFVFEIKGNLRS